MVNEKVGFYPENIKGIEQIEITVPFLGNFAHVSVTKEALISNLLSEAEDKHQIQPTEAREYARGIHYFLSFSPEFYDQINQTPSESMSTKILTSLKLALKRPPEYPGNPALDTAFSFGWTLAIGQDTSCVINIEKIANVISENKTESFQLPYNAPKEARQAVFVQAIDSVWRHEREHLIQLLEMRMGISNIDIQKPIIKQLEEPAYQIQQPSEFTHNSPFQITFEE
ncbi:MAG TPA: hypothetical protein VLF89_00635 [Candidatus Saccharimonadales bacterium]|nr:hypothetical protein [Candidatus Saccharimonadales bacterium]